MDAELKDILMNGVRSVGKRLSSQGFSQRGLALRKRKDKCLGIINFQSSVKSSQERLIFTVNVGIVVDELLDGATSRNPSVWDAQVQTRIGHLMPQGDDVWWNITKRTSPVALAEDIGDIIERFAVPFIDKYLDPSEIVALWESGQSPGLTELQRQRLLTNLKQRIGAY